MADINETTKINETLYQHNQELVVKNKTLALLEKLYNKSISLLTPEEMAQEIINVIREDLNLEFAGIFIFRKKVDTLAPLAFSKSERLIETLKKLGFMFLDIKITDVSKRDFLKKISYDQNSDMTDNLEEIWGNLITSEDLKTIKEESNIKTIMLFPLLSDTQVREVLILGLNRQYETLNTFEKSSITSFINVIALSLSKAYLYKDLQDANMSLKNLMKQRESLVHLITHKVKGSFTHSKYIFAGILDGTFGAITPELKKMAENGLESDNTGINTVDLVLNTANMQKGLIKYDLKKVDFKDIIENSFSEKKIPAEKKGLEIEKDIKKEDYYISGDAFWLKEAISNLIDNAIKYTREGKIIIHLEKIQKTSATPETPGKIIFSIKDTGIGITEEDKNNLFTEGGRGRDSVKVNVDSTGYGLFTVKLIVDAHGGKVWAESQGVNKGATFFIELPLVE